MSSSCVPSSIMRPSSITTAHKPSHVISISSSGIDNSSRNVRTAIDIIRQHPLNSTGGKGQQLHWSPKIFPLLPFSFISSHFLFFFSVSFGFCVGCISSHKATVMRLKAP
eukprot:scaffold602395_cov20-Prasinocladus_malaysianus.AAC.1